ncbi:MAG: tetrahydrofolate dehydrogenase/cyclohydrolase catalytic domain-containing protein [Candidatus Saccharimonadales bacterium]
MKLLNGSDLAGFIQERQARQVRALRQAHHIAPHLAIIRTNPAPVVDRYMMLKQTYGNDIMIDVTVHSIGQDEAISRIKQLNKDEAIHGIIVQVPLPDPAQTDEILNAVSKNKDVDGLAAETEFDSATPMAIDWLLAGYNVELKGKQIVVIGQGRLIGKPLTDLWRSSGYTVQTVDITTKDIAAITKQADAIVCAVGQPGLLTADMVKPNAVIVDAGVATDGNHLVGDVAPDVRNLPDITITPEKGGVGPLTVCALFENVIRAAQKTVVN